MKKTKWLGLLAVAVFVMLSSRAQPPAPTPTAGPGQPPPAAAVLYLRDLGLSSQTITAMLNRDAALRPQTLPSVTPPSAPQPATPPPTPEPTPTEPAAPGPTYVSSPPPEVNYSYTDLAPYGTWVSLPGYGWCWQPRAVAINRAWRPYCDSGHWIYTDCGWCWQSSYSWGWAPFHYGRWATYPGCGWVWMPGTTWAPAWVSWRVAGDHCGWAPLPPAAHEVAVHQLPPAQVTKIYNQTTIINNTTVNNNIIVNKGIPVAHVASVTHTEIRPIKIQDAPAGMTRTTTVQTFARNNSVVYRPQLKAPAKPPVVVAQKVDETHPVIYHQPISTFASTRTSTTRGSVWAPQNTSRGSSTVSAPAASPGRSQFQSPGPTRPSNDKSPSYAPSYSAPKTSQAPPSAASGASAAASRPEPTAESVDSPKQTTISPAASKSDASSQTSPWGTSSPSGSRLGQSSSQGQNSHVYHPKGYYQANESRASSQSSQRQSSSPPSSSSNAQSPPPK